MAENDKYTKMDDLTEDGAFVVPGGRNYDMKAIRDYCKRENKKYCDLSDSELHMFESERAAK